MKNKKYIVTGFIGLGILVSFLTYQTSRANPSYFATQGATTGYMSPGKATTTAQIDAQTGTSQALDSATLLLSFTGSTTPINSDNATTTYNILIERSQDGTTYYQDSIATSTATGLNQFNLTPTNSYTITLGSNTINGMVVSSTSPTSRIISVPTPTRYTRAVITIPVGSTNGYVSAQFIGKRETSY